MNLSRHNTGQVRLWLCLTYFNMSYCPLLKFRFRTFLCHLSTYWVEISYMNLSWHNTVQVRLWLRLTYFNMSYCPLLKFRFPDFLLLFLLFPRCLSFCPSVRLSFCPSVSQSVSPLGVRPLGFPNFSQSTFEILNWNVVYGFVLT